MNTNVYLLLGSNLGDRIGNLSYARQEISRDAGQIITTSSLYKTAAWGTSEQPDFYNQVIKIQSQLSPEELLATTLKIEEKAGRLRMEKWGPRTLDIDILFFGSTVLESNNLVIPHREIQNRKFTLLPLDEIASDFMHPVLKATVHQLLMDCPDTLSVQKL